MVDKSRTAPSGLAVGVTTTAAMLLIIAGVCSVMQGIVALATNEFFVVTQNWLFKFDTTTWGWIHILVGIVALLAGVGLFFGAVWARTVGVIIAVLSAVVNFLWLPWYPVWAVVIIVFDVFVIWALTAHGRDVTTINKR
jgi:hypothetical protein